LCLEAIINDFIDSAESMQKNITATFDAAAQFLKGRIDQVRERSIGLAKFLEGWREP
jgi:hypothetical protein